jgi:uncharacterized protein (TIGR03437 family)
MRIVLLLTIGAAACATAAANSKPLLSSSIIPPQPQAFAETNTRFPLVFEPNRGQADKKICYISRGPGRTILLTSDGAILVLGGEDGARVRMQVVGANRHSRSQPLEPLASASNYFIGNDPSKWRTAVPHFGRIRYRDIYPGIDLVYYGNDRQLEYDFVVGPGMDPGVIQLAYHGADSLRVESNGDLTITAAGRTIRQQRPKIYQSIGGRQIEIAGGYRVVEGSGRVRFTLARYDRRHPLVIDPVIQYATYLGRTGQDSGIALAVDARGNAYVAGETNSIDFQLGEVVQPRHGGALDAFIAKFSELGQLQYMTYLGGPEANSAPGTGIDTARAIAVDTAGNMYLAGSTNSVNFPIANALQPTFGGGGFDAYIAKINAAGTQLLYSTFLGGTGEDWANGLAVDASGEVYISGWTRSPNFPVRGGYQSGPSGGGEDVFVTRIDSAGRTLLYSTFVGGNGRDVGTGIAIDSAGSAYVTGSTTSTIFPTSGTLQPRNAGKEDAFLFKLNTVKNALEYSTFIGGSENDLGNRVAVDAQGNAYVTGYTSSANFPVRSAAQGTPGGAVDTFVLKVAPDGSSLIYSTFLGGSADDYGFGSLVVDAAGSAYVTGWTESANFPVRNPVQPASGGATDAFVARLSPAGDGLIYSTYIGGAGEDKAYGIALDRQSNVYLTGHTTSPNFPSAQGNYDPGSLGTADVFMLKLSADTSVNFISAAPAALNVTAASGGVAPAAQTLAIASSGNPLRFTATASVPWVQITPTDGTTPASLSISIATAGLTSGSHTGEITISAPGSANSSLRIPVNLALTAAPAPLLTAAGIVSAATGRPGPVAPGQIITVYGADFGTDTSQLRLLFEAEAAHILSVSGGQLNAVVPLSVAGKPDVPVVVEYAGQRSAAVTVPVTQAAPGLFTSDASGRGQAAAQNENGSTNRADNPAARGSIIVLYGTGQGQPSDNGGPALPVSVQIGGVPAEVLYAGPVAGMPGLLQVNARIGTGTTPAAAVPVVLTIGGVSSSPDVTVAVQ